MIGLVDSNGRVCGGTALTSHTATRLITFIILMRTCLVSQITVIEPNRNPREKHTHTYTRLKLTQNLLFSICNVISLLELRTISVKSLSESAPTTSGFLCMCMCAISVPELLKLCFILHAFVCGHVLIVCN